MSIRSRRESSALFYIIKGTVQLVSSDPSLIELYVYPIKNGTFKSFVWSSNNILFVFLNLLFYFEDSVQKLFSHSFIKILFYWFATIFVKSRGVLNFI